VGFILDAPAVNAFGVLLGFATGAIIAGVMYAALGATTHKIRGVQVGAFPAHRGVTSKGLEKIQPIICPALLLKGCRRKA